MNTGHRIKARRKKLGLSVDDLALATGKDRTTIFRYEKGTIEKIPSSVLEPIASVLQTTPGYLLGLSDEVEQICKKKMSSKQEEAITVLCRSIPNMTDEEIDKMLDMFNLMFDNKLK